jgi:hypothetical protein
MSFTACVAARAPHGVAASVAALLARHGNATRGYTRLHAAGSGRGSTASAPSASAPSSSSSSSVRDAIKWVPVDR